MRKFITVEIKKIVYTSSLGLENIWILLFIYANRWNTSDARVSSVTYKTTSDDIGGRILWKCKSVLLNEFYVQ